MSVLASKKDPWIKSLLTPREKEILLLLCKGFTNKEIGASLYLFHRTVEKYRTHLLMKSRSRNTAHLISQAYEWGWL